MFKQITRGKNPTGRVMKVVLGLVVIRNLINARQLLRNLVLRNCAFLFFMECCYSFELKFDNH
jgi:hypothetical protein